MADNQAQVQADAQAQTEQPLTFERWFAQQYPDPNERQRQTWLIAAVRAHRKWGENREGTEEEFRSALDEVSNLMLGGSPQPT